MPWEKNLKFKWFFHESRVRMGQNRFFKGKAFYMMADPTLAASPVLETFMPVFVFLIMALGLSLVLAFLGWVRGPKTTDYHKTTPYECGFEPFDSPREKFDIKFYLVALLFIVFDLEIAFLFPWAISLGNLGAFGFWSMMIFLGVLTLGFIYEWKKGALEWT